VKLEIHDLRISFGPREVVHIDELVCDSGEIVGLVGESGSGKSMTATAVMGLAHRIGAMVTGSICLDGRELVGLRESSMRPLRGRRISLIFQSPSLAFNPVMRVGVVFTRSLRLHEHLSRGAARRRAADAVAELFLPESVLDRYPLELSGGQLQRVAIALSLALKADVLLADEPTSALDVTVQAELLVMMRRLAKVHRQAVLLISHDLAVVAETADRVAVMRAGELVEVGSVGEVLAHPRHEYTRELLSAGAQLEIRSEGGGRRDARGL
jgi:peptide/nickel transport system ATP-binding protein